MVVLSELQIRANVDLGNLSTFERQLERVASGSISAQEGIASLRGQVERLEEDLAKTKQNTAQWIEADERLKKAQEELNKALGEEGKKAFQSAQQEAKILTQEQKEAAKAADEHEKKLKKLARSAVGFLGQYFAIKKTFSAVMGFAKEGEELARMADLSGMSAQGIERLGIALKNYGGSASSASATLSKLNQQMQDLKFGKGGKLSQVAIRYGLNLNANTPEQMLLNIAKRMEGLGATQQVAMGRMLGLDNATLLLVQQGVEGVRKELEKASELSVFSKEDIENSQKLNRSYRELEQRWNQLKSVLNRGLLPVFQVVIERLSKIAKYFKENPEQIKTIATIAGVAFGALFVALSPFTALFAAIGVGIALLVDDFVAFKQGGEAALKPVWEWLDVIWGTIKGIATAFYDLGQGIGKGIAGIVNWFKGDSATPSAMEIGAKQIATADSFAGNTMTNNSIMSSSYTNSPVQYSYNVGKMELAFPGVTSKSVVDNAVYSIGRGIASNFGDTKK